MKRLILALPLSTLTAVQVSLLTQPCDPKHLDRLFPNPPPALPPKFRSRAAVARTRDLPN